MDNKNEGKQLWNVNPSNPTNGRLYEKGHWGEDTSLEIAQLDYLHYISKDVQQIRFRIGVLAVVVLIFVVLIPFYIFITVLGALAP